MGTAAKTSKGGRQGRTGAADEQDATARFRDRIIDFRRVPASQIRLNPLNPRSHPSEQRQALTDALSRRGITAPVLTRQLPDGTLELIDGELRTTTLDQPVPCIVTDLSEE